MTTFPEGTCPDCGILNGKRGSWCCESCHNKRKDEMKSRENMPVGGLSSSPEYEALEIYGGSTGTCYVRDRASHRGLPAMRDDVKWHQYKHGGG